MNNIGQFGNNKFFNVNPINNVSPAAVNPATTGGATEVPSTTSDQFVSIGNRAVVNSGLVNKKNDDINAVLPPPLNLKKGTSIELTESSLEGKELVIAKFMVNPNSMGSIIIDGLA